MKTLRQLLVASVFTFVLVTPTFAGQMDTMVAPPPAPAGEIQTPVAGQMDTTLAGEIETTNSEADAGGFALSLMQSVLALF